MKKLLAASLLINIAFISLLIYRKIKPKKVKAVPESHKAFFKARNDIFELTPIDSNDIVFIGNSITEGFPVTEFFGAKNRGVRANRTLDILERISPIIKAKPRKIFLMTGVNDIEARVPVNLILATTRIIIDSIKKGSPTTKIFIQSVLPTSGKFKYLNPEIKKYNELLKSYCGENKLTFIDLKFPGIDTLSWDGVHLNAKGYELLKQQITPYLGE